MEARYDINPAPDVTTEKELKQLMRENGEKSQQYHDRFIKRIDRKNAQARDTLTSLREANDKLRAQGAKTDEAIARLRDSSAQTAASLANMRAALLRMRRVEGE